MTMTTSAVEYTLDASEVAAIREASKRMSDLGENPTDPAFYDRHWDSHLLLPPGLGHFLEAFRRTEPGAYAVVRNFPIDDRTVGPTPAHWNRVNGLDGTRDPDLFLAMCGLALGEPFAWATLQNGRMLQDVFPIRGDEQRLSGHGSDAFLVFHTDDAFHPDSCDYLLLFGIRNRDRVPTFVSSVRDLADLSPEHRRILGERRFYIMPDDEHIRQLELHAPNHPALASAVEMRDRPKPVPVLHGAHLNPYVRVDRPFMRCVGDDPAAQVALAALDEHLHAVRRAVVVDEGTLLILDNRVAVHAREAFTARYDGTDRWLRKIIVSRGLRRWASNGAEPGSRVLF